MNNDQPTGYLALPSAKQGPPVLILHAWWGLNEDIKNLCDRLANEGFVAFALDFYYGKVANNVQDAESLGSELDSHYKQALQEVGAATAWLSDSHDTKKLGVALIAFSLGVWYALEQSNADPEHIRKVVTFYGTREGDYSRSQAEYLGHFAEIDAFEPQANINAMVQSIQQAGRTIKVHTYPNTGHWFFEPSQEEAYAPGAANLAFKRTLDFLKN